MLFFAFGLEEILFRALWKFPFLLLVSMRVEQLASLNLPAVVGVDFLALGTNFGEVVVSKSEASCVGCSTRCCEGESTRG